MTANTNVAGSFTSSTQSSEIVVSARDFLLKIGGTFSASIALQIFNVQANAWQTIKTYTAPAVEAIDAVARGQRFRLDCTFTSGTASYEMTAPND